MADEDKIMFIFFLDGRQTWRKWPQTVIKDTPHSRRQPSWRKWSRQILTGLRVTHCLEKKTKPKMSYDIMFSVTSRHKDRRVASTDRLCYSITENNCTSSSSQAQRRCLHTTVNCIICGFLHERIHGCGCIRSCWSIGVALFKMCFSIVYFFISIFLNRTQLIVLIGRSC